MIFIDNRRISFEDESKKDVKSAKEDLEKCSITDRSDFINSLRDKTWGSREIIKKMIDEVGYKCWYSEIFLEGSDPNIDHFRPKGEITEIELVKDFPSKKEKTTGYWWLAFDLLNYRLSSQHANQRRSNTGTTGGKWNFFPVEGQRASENTPIEAIRERYLGIDPCSAVDVALMGFDNYAHPIWSGVIVTGEAFDKMRVEISIWLYHLNKGEISRKRGKIVEEFSLIIEETNLIYEILKSDRGDVPVKEVFSKLISRLISEISNKSEFSAAKKCKLKIVALQYDWIETYIL